MIQPYIDLFLSVLSGIAYSAIILVKPCTERFFARVAVDFNARVVAVVQNQQPNLRYNPF